MHLLPELSHHPEQRFKLQEAARAFLAGPISLSSPAPSFTTESYGDAIELRSGICSLLAPMKPATIEETYVLRERSAE
ncbi:hypothetical protein FE782_29005 [Paenibacillus antri]|uniref:Uncharacterized protein n=1 Tax=Paenibacillus antri TaxID=2582848 RepID=A0A5R9G3B3_9BACL|nr:hypothetical protein [Paenibacillus antri]TLS48786.1 hypothetical protein FE782_29005 [Paenibacillus antri]